jgi:high-affinity K+ transport system ATPase subunit B
MVIVFSRWHDQCYKLQNLYTHFLPVAEDMFIIQTVKYSFFVLYTLLDFKFHHNMDTSYLFVISVFLYIFVLLSSNMDGRGKARFHGLVCCTTIITANFSTCQTKDLSREKLVNNKKQTWNHQVLHKKQVINNISS